nr:hypothetical protein [Geothrix fuzhouensis]
MQTGLSSKVEGDEAAVDSCRIGDLSDGGAFEPLLGEDADGGFQ